MKIKLVSIEGKIADPIHNVQQMIDEIETADEEGVDLLVFPDNSFSGKSLDNIKQNETYSNSLKGAYEMLKDYLEDHTKPFVIFRNPKHVNYNQDIKIYVENNSEIETLESLANIENEYKAMTKDNENLYIVCRGRETESTSQYIYSNVKLIAYKGKILASNLENDENSLTFDFTPDVGYSRTPYLDEIEDLNKMFKNILNLQGAGLYNKMKSMNRYKICLGVSGGLDSTVSLLACVEIFKKYNLPLKNIIGVTMPGLGTTERTYQNALNLMKELEISIMDIDLKPLLKTHLKNIEQPEGVYDVTYEQTQSRERTQVLLDIANKENAIMIGTGCMSEFALGWMTYGGDHLCMYAINIGLPKTVVKLYAQWFINKYYPSFLSETVRDILSGPVSPELLPVDEKGEQHEKTESLIGDYIVQDFFIYHMTVNNYSIKTLYNLACKTFTEFSHVNILKWLEIFTLRYFTRAYKKNCYGDGLQLFSYSVSPWYYHVPSDIDNTIWQDEIAELKREVGE